jgi:hypothetical protein
MLEQLIPLLGKSVVSEEIKALFIDWRVPYPTSVTCTANNPGMKGKVEKNCIRLHFSRGGSSRYLKPIPTTFKGGFVCIFTAIEFTKKRRSEIPFDLRFDMTADEITAILGQPVATNFMGQSTIWRKNITEKHELVVSDSLFKDGTSLRSMLVSFIYEADLYTMEDYEKAGF